MFIIKLFLHLKCIIEKFIFSLIYGNKLKLGKKCHWRKNFSLMIDKNATVSIGNDVFFNNGCSVDANDYISIGDRTMLGENVKIYDHDHRFREKLPIKKQGFKNAPVIIGKDCWIGSGVIILKGTEIGNNCIIGAGCVVSGKVKSNSILKWNGEYTIVPIIREGL